MHKSPSILPRNCPTFWDVTVNGRVGEEEFSFLRIHEKKNFFNQCRKVRCDDRLNHSALVATGRTRAVGDIQATSCRGEGHDVSKRSPDLDRLGSRRRVGPPA
jgi:hypothetical protein